MTDPAPMAAAPPGRWTAERYLALVEAGALGPEDRVELLEGVVVAMPPHSTRHAAAISMTSLALTVAVGSRCAVRTQLSLVVGAESVPEPDVALVPGSARDYAAAHPTTALLVVEVAETSLVQDRLTKGPMYAAASVPEFWIVNLRDAQVEVYREPEPAARRYAFTATARPGERLEVGALPGVSVAVDDLLPGG
jgi:Uma2 family endonuclease